MPYNPQSAFRGRNVAQQASPFHPQANSQPQGGTFQGAPPPMQPGVPTPAPTANAALRAALTPASRSGMPQQPSAPPSPPGAPMTPPQGQPGMMRPAVEPDRFNMDPSQQGPQFGAGGPGMDEQTMQVIRQLIMGSQNQPAAPQVPGSLQQMGPMVSSAAQSMGGPQQGNPQVLEVIRRLLSGR